MNNNNLSTIITATAGACVAMLSFYRVKVRHNAEKQTINSLRNIYQTAANIALLKEKEKRQEKSLNAVEEKQEETSKTTATQSTIETKIRVKDVNTLVLKTLKLF